MTFPTKPMLDELDEFVTVESFDSSKWSVNFRESLWTVPATYESSYTMSMDLGSLQREWSYGYRFTPENISTPELWEYWRKPPEGEWEQIDASHPDALALRSAIRVPKSQSEEVRD